MITIPFISPHRAGAGDGELLTTGIYVQRPVAYLSYKGRQMFVRNARLRVWGALGRLTFDLLTTQASLLGQFRTELIERGFTKLTIGTGNYHWTVYNVRLVGGTNRSSEGNWHWLRRIVVDGESARGVL